MRILSDIAKWANAVAENAKLKALLAQAKVILDDRGAIITEMCDEVGKLRADRALLKELRHRDEKVITDLRSQLADRALWGNNLEDQLMELAAERDRIAGDREMVRGKLAGEAAALRQELQTAKDHRDDAIKEAGRLRSLLGNAQTINDELAAANRGLLEVNEALRPDAQRWRARQLRESLRGQRRAAARAAA